MSFDMSEIEFLDWSKISQEDWTRSGVTWDNLSAIASAYSNAQPTLISTAEQLSSRIRTFEGVHSVRWRIKNPLHLLKKIIRKNLEDKPQEKWRNINSENYLSCATDLIGVRALHLFKDECLVIDNSIRNTWDICEPATIYIREGDNTHPELIERGGQVKDHEFGYRSIHYLVSSKPEKQILTAEIQVRTIFQEGWSEIDHKVKYPDYSDNQEVKLFLQVFNGLAGSADEMGSFVKNLTKVLSENERTTKRAFAERQAAIEERDQAMEKISSSIAELNTLKNRDKESQALIQDMQENLKKLKETQTLPAADYHNWKSFDDILLKQQVSFTNKPTLVDPVWNDVDIGKSIASLGKALSEIGSIGKTQKKRDK
ncbi:RelA/SpoT domain-containing protein [Pseudomonas psychrophila]|uniref:RelA/SpoT domain-containing protein n=1 Tax=Pseudomonas psychrophila TaxID=122355 RepID=UPI000315F671|nr:RelA/SpoT domain-containing protein [Pseudomonas psychrophila]